ncbi:hypothetical protein LguiA_036359 [Lonicera macranthoides]
MGHEFRHKCPVDSKRSLLLTGLVFSMVLMVQYFELPYGNVLSSLFSGSKAQIPASSPDGDSSQNTQTTFLDNLNSTNTSVAHEIANITKISEGTDLDLRSNFVSERNGDSDDVLEFDEDGIPKNQPVSDNFALHNNLTRESVKKNDGSAPEKARESLYGFLADNVTTNDNSSPDYSNEEQKASTLEEKYISVDSGPASSYSLTPIPSPPLISPKQMDTNLSTPVYFSSHAPLLNKDPVNSLHKNEEHEQLQSVPAVMSISEMNKMLLQSRISSHSMKPQWPSVVDQELLDAKSHIENAPVTRKTPGLYAALYQNVSMFRRSYELMEQTLKVYIYREGKRPIFHQTVLKGIYASEGWFMKLLKANKQYVTKNPKKAHLFYLPFSSRMLEETLYIPNSHSDRNLVQYLKNYLDMIVAKYPFWNRTGGADHFLVACHDWAPSETRQIMANCIRALCNSDIREGFKFGKDVSLPETTIQSPQNLLRNLGGNPSSNRPILAFFAGRMHGYLRPVLLQHWQNKDPDMKIFARLPKAKHNRDYINYMKSSKYCICAKGFEVNSPRVVEAIFYECVPVVISDNFVPPFFEVLNWKSFAIFVKEKDIPNLKNILLSISERKYILMQQRVKQVQQHFLWHGKPVKYDIFNMILHSIWSYELMEKILKVHIYQEGERPIFHQPVLRGIYASKGWFMKLLEANKQQTGGADHFLVACHDWAPSETIETSYGKLHKSSLQRGYQSRF